MIDKEIQIGDYVKFVYPANEELNEIEYETTGVVISRDTSLKNLIRANKWKILTENSEEISIFENELEIDIQAERNYTLKTLFRDEQTDKTNREEY